MHDITFRSGGSNFNYSTPVQEAQDHFAPAAANSPPPAATMPVAPAPGGQQRPVAMPSMQAQLLRQLEAGPSNQSRQEGVRHSATTSSPLSAAQLNQVNQLNQAMLAEFRRKADANPDNTPLTKDYYCDVLVELADWLKQQPPHPGMHSLLDLVGFACEDNHLYNFITTRNLEKLFTASGAAPVRMGKPNPRGLTDIDLGHVIEALNLSRHKPRITLPPAFASRQDERLLHTFRDVLLGQGTLRRTADNNVSAFRYCCMWLHQQTALGKPIPHGLDSLEKLRDHPNENEVKEVIDCFRRDPETTRAIGKQAFTAVIKFRNLMRQPPAPATSGLRTQPTPQQPPVHPEQPANLAPPYSSSLIEFAFTKEEIDSILACMPEERGEQHGASSATSHAQVAEASRLEAQPHGIRRPAHRSEDEPRAVRPRLDPAPPEQPANLAPPHSSSLTEPAITDEEIAFLNKIFK